MAIGWAVLYHMMDQWRFSRRKKFFDGLWQMARTQSGDLVAWPDVLVVLRNRFPEAICQAARKVLEELPKPTVSLCELQPERRYSPLLSGAHKPPQNQEET